MDWNKFLSETKANFEKFSKSSPETFKGFGIVGKDAKKNGALSEKTKEFIALGISIATRCESCIGLHMEHLVRLGATREEIIEALSMSSYMGGGPSITYSAKALDAYEQIISKNS
ncbi:MAG: carboxymuconolactone decarboxylase family protein [Pseudomonadota bacterium]|nr:carboxymuconolactone decarboxylase family protein [Pseudomonadota bacterium]